jgi:hypothetical protein
VTLAAAFVVGSGKEQLMVLSDTTNMNDNARAACIDNRVSDLIHDPFSQLGSDTPFGWATIEFDRTPGRSGVRTDRPATDNWRQVHGQRPLAQKGRFRSVTTRQST